MKNSYGKLIVENFGPIKEAEIDLKQLMLFIGPQGSGKSTLLKLIAAFKSLSSQKIAYRHDEFSWERDFTIDFLNEGLGKYNIGDYLFSKEGALKHEITKNDFSKNTYIKIDFISFAWEFKDRQLKLIINDKLIDIPDDFDLYIPAERNFFSTYSNVTQSLVSSKIPIPETLSNFGSNWEFAKNKLKEHKIDFLNITYKFQNNGDFIFYNKKDSVRLENSASGFQSVVPMYLIIDLISQLDKWKDTISYEKYLEQIKNERTGLSLSIRQQNVNHRRCVFIEEPELNLFPSAQKSFAEFLASRLIQYHQKPNSLIVSTHSPYIITAFDNLIQAGNAFKKSPKLETKIVKIIPKDCWIDFDNVSAYYLEKGKSKSILNKTNRLIAGNKIDDVTEELGIEFDQLLNLKYPN